MKKLRVYVDTSVIGGCLDAEFRNISERFVGLVHERQVILVVSDLMVSELQGAPENVQRVLDALPEDAVEFVEADVESVTLRDEYLAAGVVGESHVNDAHHVALATVSKADMIVSWNFRHIVHFEKIRGFNAVNLKAGYGAISIYSPLEVV